jgi:hypothetical protein
MTTTYKLIKNELGSSYLERTDEAGVISFIPIDEANSDYQAYLNKDKAEQSTPMVTDAD